MERQLEIRPTSQNFRTKGGVYGIGRILIGRGESCELLINHDSVSTFHAVLEIYADRAVLYDLNSINGTYVNDAKIVVKEVGPGDFIRCADIEFEISEANSAD